MKTNLKKALRYFGASEKEILFFDESANSRTLNYLSLLPKSFQFQADVVLPNGVIETDNRPILYFIDNGNLAKSQQERADQIEKARRILACLGDGAILGILEPGQITLLPCTFEPLVNDGEIVQQDDPEARGLIRDLAMASLPETLSDFLYGAEGKKRKTIHDLLFKILNHVTDALLAINALNDKNEAVLSLVGRALLTRFLIDRNIINQDTFPEIFENNHQDCFSSPESTAQTCRWLDKTFNGELLSLPDENYEKWFQTLDPQVFTELAKILSHATPEGQLHLYKFVDYAHVPVGLLSEVYERYAHKHFERHAKTESIHYTPHHIAEFMISQSFQAIETTKPYQAKILDPSSGAGIFLVLALRRLVAERWEETKIRPDSDEIREILYSQIRGFDINSAALKLAALSLYLTVLELDPYPFPPEKLRFKNIIGTVLHGVRLPGEEFPVYPVLGSLGPAVGPEHDNQYDLVIGNPPWTSWEKEWKDEFTSIIRDVANRRDPVALNDVINDYEHPDKVPDLPFVWRGMDWAKQGAVIAFALHARLLFKRLKKPATARNQLFRAIKITGILNGSALRQTKVWPNMKAQFCLLFAKNEIPGENDFFRFVSPQLETILNKQSKMRIDYLSAEPVQPSVLEQTPSLLKTLFRGSALDADIILRLERLVNNSKAYRFGEYWNKAVGKGRHGVGFQKSSTIQDAEWLIKLRALELSSEDGTGYVINADQLNLFNRPRLHRTRKKEIFEPPLVIIKKAPGEGGKSFAARIYLDDRILAYDESFYGFSAHGHKDAANLARYLFLIVNSDLLIYYILMASSQYGVEREAMIKKDLELFPIIPFENLSSDNLKLVNKLSNSLQQDSKSNCTALNKFVNHLYGLSDQDYQVIKDSLATSLPIADAKEKAESKPKSNELSDFKEELKQHLQPFFDLVGDTVNVNINTEILHSWSFITVSNEQSKSDYDFDTISKNLIEEVAEQSGASRVVIPLPGQLHIGMPAQYRYWTLSRARLCALDILRNYGEHFRNRGN